MGKRIGVLLSGRGSNFEALAHSVAAGRLPGAEIAVVVSNREGAPGVAKAKERGIAVRAIVDDLRQAGYVEQEKVGRRNRYRINPARPVRYLGERAVTVGELLDLLWREEGPARRATS